MHEQTRGPLPARHAPAVYAPAVYAPGVWSPAGAGLAKTPDGVWATPVTAGAAVQYPEDGNEHCLGLEEGSFWFAHRNRCIAAVVRRWRPDGPLVDVGAGNGYVALGLRDAGIPVIAVEPGPAGARNARARGLDPVLCATLAQAHFPARSVAGVGLFDVIEHVPDDVAFLREVRDTLRPGGYVYVTVPAFQALWSAEDDVAGHARRYTRRTLGAALDRAGFDVRYMTYLFAWLPLPVFLFRALPSRLGRRRAEEGTRGGGEHGLPGGAAGRALAALLDAEYRRVAAGRVVPVGGSCLAVAAAR